MRNEFSKQVAIGRRAVLRAGSLIMAANVGHFDALWAEGVSNNSASADDLCVGLITDLHYADKSPGGSRHYRETIGKLQEAAAEFQKQAVSFVVELGDLIDAADSVDVEQRYLKTINREFSKTAQTRHYVLGNHCVDTLTKNEFLGGVEQQDSYYSFDAGGYHFVVLDSCFRSDGEPYGRRNFVWTDPNVPASELEWLEADLKTTEKPIVVFAHQRLDVSNSHGVKNAAQVRKVLEASGNVRTVFQGHSHQNDLKEIGGIHYCTMVAMVEGSGAENNGYSLLRLAADGTIQVQGFRKQANYQGVL